MLVLSRTAGQRIFITAPDGTVLTLLIVEVRGDKARIGIDAPRDWVIHREEIAAEIAAERRRKDSEQTPGIGEDFG